MGRLVFLYSSQGSVGEVFSRDQVGLMTRYRTRETGPDSYPASIGDMYSTTSSFPVNQCGRSYDSAGSVKNEHKARTSPWSHASQSTDGHCYTQPNSDTKACSMLTKTEGVRDGFETKEHSFIWTTDDAPLGKHLSQYEDRLRGLAHWTQQDRVRTLCSASAAFLRAWFKFQQQAGNNPVQVGLRLLHRADMRQPTAYPSNLLRSRFNIISM